MPAKAYVNDKQLYLFFENTELATFQPIVSNLGAGLTGFLGFSINDIEEIFDSIIKKTLNLKISSELEEYKQWLSKTTTELSEINPYLNFYSDILIGVLFSVVAGKLYDMGTVFALLPRANEIYKASNDDAQNDEEALNAVLAKYYMSKSLEKRSFAQKNMMLRSINNILSIKEAILLDIKEKRDFLTKELNFLFIDDVITEASMTKTQKLLFLDCGIDENGEKRDFYNNAEFSVKYSLFMEKGLEEIDNEESVITQENILEKGIDFFETYALNWVDDIVRLEFLKICENDVTIKRCSNCGRLFAPVGRVDTMYCNAIDPETSKTCVEIGAVKKYKEKTMSDPVHDAFIKAYKRNNSKVRTNKMTKKEFAEWSEKARKMRDKCSAGEFTIDEFWVWLGNKSK